MTATTATDALLEEYMRVINHKDSEILDLMAKVERLDVELRRKDDRYKIKVTELKSTLRDVQTTLSSAERNKGDEARELRALQEERDRLMHDVSTLRATVQRHEDHLKGVLRTSTKAHRHEGVSRERLEHEMRELKRAYDEKAQSALDRIAALEVQLNAAQQRVTAVTEESHQARTEGKKHAQRAAEYERELTATRGRLRDYVPRQEAAAEVQQLEERHRIIVAGLERELKRLRSDAAVETATSTRKDTMAVQLRGETQRLEQEAAAARRGQQDVELQLAQERLAAAQRLEEMKMVLETKLLEVREHNSQLAAECHRLEGDVAIMRQRVLEAEDQIGGSRRGWAEAEAAYEQEIHDLKVSLADWKRSADTNTRLVSQLQASLQAANEQTDTRVLRAEKEVSRLREQLDDAGSAAARATETLALKEAAITDARREMQRYTSTEQEMKRRLADAEAALQAALSDQRTAASQHAEELRELRSSESRGRSEAQREASILAQKLSHAEAELGRLASAIDVAHDKERQAARAQRETDAELSRLQVEATDKDATIAALRRGNETATSSSSTLQSHLDQTRKTLADSATENERLQLENAKLRFALQNRETETADVLANARRNEELARESANAAEQEVHTLTQRVRSLSSQLNDAEHRLTLEVAERNRQHSGFTEERQRITRESIGPLHEKIDVLTQQNQRVERALREKEEALAKLGNAAQERDDLRLRLEGALSEVTRLRATVSALQDAERSAALDRDGARKQRSELEAALAKLAGLQTTLDAAAREMGELHTREITLVTQVSARTAELSALNERYANADSLRKIAEKQIYELQQREMELNQRLEETRAANSMLQTCFDKQREQIETGRRMRELDLDARDRTRGSFAASH
jgi:chromosome segregation ATPase